MKKIFIPLFALLVSSAALTSCMKHESVEISKLDDLSSPNCSTYTLVLTKFQPWTSFHLVSVDALGRTYNYGFVWTDDCGNIIQQQGEWWVPVQICCADYGPGEYIDLWLMNPRGGEGVRSHIVPHPIHIEQNGYDLYLEKDDKLAHNWKVIGEGFDPGESVSVIAYLGPRVFTDVYIASNEGEIVIPIDAWVEGKSTGESRLEIEGSHGGITLNFPWGDNWFAWKKQFVADKQAEDQRYRQEVRYSNDYRPLMKSRTLSEAIQQGSVERQ